MKYFSVPELTDSDTARRRKIDNTAPTHAVENLTTLVQYVLDPLREAWGKPLTVNSGYRCPKLNQAVGGVATSYHLKGMAADISAGSTVDNRRLFQLVLDLGLPYTELIGEHGFKWLHVALDPGRVCRKTLVIQ